VERNGKIGEFLREFGRENRDQIQTQAYEKERK
jgi:hypothetical protein